MGRPVGATEMKREVFSLDLLIKGPVAPAAPGSLRKAHRQTWRAVLTSSLTHSTRAREAPCVDSNHSGPEMRIYGWTSKMATPYCDPQLDPGALVAKSLVTHPEDLPCVAPGFQSGSIEEEPWQ